MSFQKKVQKESGREPPGLGEGSVELLWLAPSLRTATARRVTDREALLDAAWYKLLPRARVQHGTTVLPAVPLPRK
jgi:hypothetical protein